MAYEKKTWKNRQSEFPNRRTMTPVDGQENAYDVTRSEGLVLEEGDAFDQNNMNDLELRIESGISEAGFFTYTALVKLDAWTSAGEEGYMQTVTATSIDGGPPITSRTQLGPPMFRCTGVKETDNILRSTLDTLNDGYARSNDDGTITVVSYDQTATDLQVYWYGKERLQ